MPVHCETTGKYSGYCQWGQSGKKYTYTAQTSQAAAQGRTAAQEAAQRQAKAAYSRGYKK